MTKIKNFRINVRIREVARLLKARQNGVPLDPEQEASLGPAVAESRTLLAPAALYATMTRQTAVHAVPFELPKKAVALSAICGTIGPRLMELRQKVESEARTSHSDVLSCIEAEALQQAMTFALRLVQDQAKKEDCTLTEPQECREPETRQKLATLLALDRIGLALADADARFPLYARLVYVVWMPTSKASGTKKVPTRPRAEKAAL